MHAYLFAILAALKSSLYGMQESGVPGTSLKQVCGCSRELYGCAQGNCTVVHTVLERGREVKSQRQHPAITIKQESKHVLKRFAQLGNKTLVKLQL